MDPGEENDESASSCDDKPRDVRVRDFGLHGDAELVGGHEEEVESAMVEPGAGDAFDWVDEETVGSLDDPVRSDVSHARETSPDGVHGHEASGDGDHRCRSPSLFVVQ